APLGSPTVKVADAGGPQLTQDQRALNKAHDDVGEEQGIVGQRRRFRPARGVGADHSALAHHPERGGEVAAEIDLGDAVDAALLRRLQQALGDVVLFVVDNNGHAGIPCDLGLGIAADGGNETAGAGEAGELRRVQTNRPGGPRDQHVATGKRAIGEQREIGGHGRHAKARAELEIDAGRHRHGLRRRQTDEVRGGAEGPAALRIPGPDALTDTRRLHAGADLVDLTRAVAVRNDQRIAGPVAATAAAVAVRRVDAGVSDLDTYLAGTRLRVGQLTQLEDLAGGA